MRKLIAILFIAMINTSCNRNNENVIVVYDTIENSVDSNNFQLISNPVIEYEGILPCASCAGIKTYLSLNSDSLTYKITETYQGKSQGDSIFSTHGKYERSLSEGDAIVIYKLTTDNPDAFRYFKESGDTAVKMLDKMQKEIASAGNYFLKKK